MVCYVRSWHWSCWCWLLLITSDRWWFLLVATAGFCCWLLVAARCWMIAGCGLDTAAAAAGWKVFEFFQDIANLRLRQFCRRKSLWIMSKRRWRNLAETSFKIVSECFEEPMEKFGRDKFGNCLRTISMRGNWILAKTIFKNVLEYFRWEAIGIWQRHYLRMS